MISQKFKRWRWMPIGALAWAGINLALNPVAGQSESIEALEKDTDRWIELQARIAKETSNWRAEKELLQSSIVVLGTEKANLEEDLKSNQLASQLYISNRDRLSATIETQQAALNFH